MKCYRLYYQSYESGYPIQRVLGYFNDLEKLKESIKGFELEKSVLGREGFMVEEMEVDNNLLDKDFVNKKREERCKFVKWLNSLG